MSGVNTQRLAYMRCTAAAVCFGVSAPAAASLADEMGSFALAGLLYLGAAVATAPAMVSRRPSMATLRAGSARLATAVLFGGALGPLFLVLGLRYTSAATSSLLLNLELVFTTIIAGLVFREHIGGRIALGTALVLAAGVTLSWSSVRDVRLGALFIALACLCWAVDNSVTAALDELAPAHLTFVKGVVAGSANLLIGLGSGGSIGGGDAMWALLIGVVGYGLSITWWVAGARDLGAARAQLVFATAPFIGAVVSWLWLSEAVTAQQLAAVVLAAAGVLFVIGSSHEHAHAHPDLQHEHEHSHDDGHHDHAHADGFTGRHVHRHAHAAVTHVHAHVPDVHHRHSHDGHE
jgi:drug/metabolite transporter (DMT)-like permease